MAELEFHVGDIVRVVDLKSDRTFAIDCGLPMGWSGQFATITDVVSYSSGNIYYIDGCLFAWPARALELIERKSEHD